MSAAAATPYDRRVVPDDQTFSAAAAVRAFDELAEHGGLITKGELATRWGITTQFAGELVRRPGFPKPLDKFGRTGVYVYAEILAWQRHELERPGRRGPKQPAYAAAISAEPDHDVVAAKRAAARLRRHGGLIDVAGVALRLGVTRQAVQRYDGKPGFPIERARAAGPLYLVAEADAWARGRKSVR